MQDGSYLCEQDGTTCAKPQHRYIFSLKFVDFSGEVWANVFTLEVCVCVCVCVLQSTVSR